MHLSYSRPSSSNLPGQEKREKRENREKSKEKGKRGGETSPISFALGVCVRAVLSPPPVALLQSLLLPFSGLLSGCPLSACLPRLAQIYILPPEFGISFSLCCSIGCACLSCSRIQRQFLKEASHFPLCLASVSLAPSPSFSGNFRKSTMVLWVFGYGSLVWNPGFEFDEKIIGYIKDHRRVFDLACIDHRGTPESPARTLTLEAKKGAICWGAAYCVKGGPEKERLAMKYLENRECEYDLKTQVDFYKDGDSLPAITGVLVFTSTPCNKTNKYYIGPAPLEEMARQIATATGPCGNNREYLFKLEIALYDIGHQEDSVVELANEVRKVLVRLREQRMIGAQLSMKSQLSPVPHISTLPETTVMDSR